MSWNTDCIDQALGWAVGKMGSREYRYSCLDFVEDAYEKGAGLELDGYSSAKEAVDSLKVDILKEKNSGVPPPGAYVFYSCRGTLKGVFKDWGHVALLLGKGKVIHAWDEVRVDNYLEVQNLQPGEGWSRAEYIAWVPAEEYPRKARSTPPSNGKRTEVSGMI